MSAISAWLFLARRMEQLLPRPCKSTLPHPRPLPLAAPGPGAEADTQRAFFSLFAPARQPQAFTINPRLYLYVTRLAQHLAPHLRLNVMFPFCVGHKEHLRPKRAAFGAKVGVQDKGDASLVT